MRDRPRLALGTWPTPVREMPRVSELLGRPVWVKVEEECGAWGGNKVRKLEYILGAARRDGIDTLVSYGAGTSNWAAALAHHAHANGIKTVIGLAGPLPPSYGAIYRRCETTIVRPDNVNLLPFASALARVKAGRSARSIPMGGTGPGDVGSVHVGIEVADAIVARTIPEPAAIFVAAGTTGTSAGLAAGLALKDVSVDVVPVRVAPWPYGKEGRVASRAKRLLREFGRSDLESSLRIRGDERFFKPGYAKPNPASEEAIEIAASDNVALDGTYAAKAFASLIDRARTTASDEPLLFIHTSPGPPPQD